MVMQCSQQHQSSTTLRKTIVGTKQDTISNIIASMFQTCHVLIEDWRILNPWNILHRHKIRKGLLHKSREFIQQWPTFLMGRVRSTPLRRKRLTWCASRQKPNI